MTIRFNDTFSGTIYTEKGSPNCVYVNGAELRQAEYEAKVRYRIKAQIRGDYGLFKRTIGVKNE